MTNVLNKILNNNARTFSNEKTLPKLPIPTLESTFGLYLLSVKAITKSGYDNLESKVKKFLNSTDAEKLQKYLLSRYYNHDCWIYDLWLSESYLKIREPLIPNLNITGQSSLHENVWLPLSQTEIYMYSMFHPIILTRCATYIYGLLKYYLILRNEYLVPSMSRDQRQLSMHQFRFLFNTCRIPQTFEDKIVNKFRVVSEGSCPENIIVACNGRIFNLDLTTRLNHVYSIESISAILNEIMKYCGNKDSIGSCVSSLTSLPRSDWAKVRVELLNESTNNRSIMSLIEGSLFWVNLDLTNPPVKLEYLQERALKGDARNIWADKSLYLSFSKNGLITWGVDHTSLDGITLTNSLSIVETMIKQGRGTIKLNDITMLNTEDINSTDIDWKELNIDLTNNAKLQIQTAYTLFRNNCKKLGVKTMKFEGLNRKVIRKLKFHPDTVFQLCLQLAYSRMFGINNLASVYETGTTRYFRFGRTETIRSCTLESSSWIRSVTKLGPHNSKTVDLFVLAHEAHNNMRVKCESGLGCDRHILGLINASESDNDLRSLLLEEIIQDDTWTISGGGGSYKLSTSPVGASYMNIGVSPMNNGRFGVFYRILEEYTEVVVTYWNDSRYNGTNLLEHLKNSFFCIPTVTLSANL